MDPYLRALEVSGLNAVHGEQIPDDFTLRYMVRRTYKP
jgi:hypothetical protein